MNYLDTNGGKSLFMRFLKKYKKSSMKVYQSEIKQFFDFYKGDLSDLSEQDIIEYRNHLLMSVSSKSLTRKISILSRFFSFIDKSIDSFQNPISGNYGSQTRYKKAYPQTERYEADVFNWLKSLTTMDNTKKTYQINLNQFFEWFKKAPKEITI
ncbi:integrase family protein, partial [Candidatus Magnetomorum sp. HK-1]